MNNDSETNLDSEYLGITEAAEYLRVSASTLRRWEKKGFLIPERTPTGIRRYTKKQLDDVIQSPPQHDVATAVSSAPATDYQMQSDYSLNTPPEESNPWQTEPSVAEIDSYIEETDVVTPTITEDDEVKQLHSFFQQAGYSFEPSQDTSQSFYSKNDAVAPQVDEPVAHEVEQQELPKLDYIEERIEVETPSERIEVFHDEYMQPEEDAHTYNEPFKQPRQDRVETTDDLLALTDDQEEEEYEEPVRSEQPTKKRPSKKKLVIFTSVFVAVLFIVFISWSVYSFYSSPGQLYSPVIE